MVTKKTGANKGKIKVGKLKLNRETVKNLTTEETKQIKGKAANVNIKAGQYRTQGGSCCNCSFSCEP